LDDGEDAIFLSDTKFSNFMGKIEDLTGGEAQTDTYKESMDEIKKEAAEQNNLEPAHQTSDTFPEDDDVKNAPKTPNNDSTSAATNTQNIDAPDAILQNGMAFLQGFMKTLQSPEKTKNLVKSITEKDEKTGKTYLKIPVESGDLVQRALEMLGGLLKK